jgi:HEAT repeats
MPGNWGMTPRQSILAECDRRGRPAVIAGCISLLDGEDADDQLILALAGPHAANVLAGAEGGRSGYWPRVWAVRGLLHVWGDEAAPAIVRAAGDEHWRVREMAAKVIAAHQVGDALDAAAALRDDPVPRVRAAADRAVVLVSAAGE